jgi:uncharacterized membrane protein
MKNKQDKTRKRNLIWRYSFATLLIIFGIVLSYFNMSNEFLGFSSVSLWLIYVGFVMLTVITLQMLFKKERIVDERMEFIASKASRVTFIGIILFAFLIMIIDGIKPIEIAYSYFMSYLICGIVLLYIVSYKILSNKY